MSKLSRFLFGKNPANAAQPFLEQIPEMGREQYNPYIQEGNEARSSLSGIYKNMASDPAAFLDQLRSQYSPSKGYQMKKDELSQALGNTAAAGGYRTSPFHQKQQLQLVDSLLDEDMQDWMSQVLGIQGQGLQGQEGFANRGFGANQNLADILGGSLNQQAGLAFQGQNQKNQNRGSIMSLIAQLGGTALGGPIGGAIGGALANKFAGGNLGKGSYEQGYSPASDHSMNYEIAGGLPRSLRGR